MMCLNVMQINKQQNRWANRKSNDDHEEAVGFEAFRIVRID